MEKQLWRWGSERTGMRDEVLQREGSCRAQEKKKMRRWRNKTTEFSKTDRESEGFLWKNRGDKPISHSWSNWSLDCEHCSIIGRGRGAAAHNALSPLYFLLSLIWQPHCLLQTFTSPLQRPTPGSQEAKYPQTHTHTRLQHTHTHTKWHNTANAHSCQICFRAPLYKKDIFFYLLLAGWEKMKINLA